MGREVELIKFEVLDNPKYPDDKDIVVVFNDGSEKQVTLSESTLRFYVVQLTELHDAISRAVTQTKVRFSPDVQTAFIEKYPKAMSMAHDQAQGIALHNIAAPGDIGRVKESIITEGLASDSKGRASASKVFINKLKKDGTTPAELNLIAFFTSITHISCSEQIFADHQNRENIADLLSLMENLEKITVPATLTVEDYAPYVRKWQALWTREPNVVQINQTAESPPPRADMVDSDEVEERQSPISPNNQKPPIDYLDAVSQEEHIWYGGVAIGAAVAMTAVATVNAVKNKSANPVATLHTLYQIEMLAGRVMRTANAVPVLSSVLRFTGTIANNTLVPVAKGVMNYMTRK
jgi:hypothetical protein